MAPPLALNVEEFPWPISAADAIICINMIHISPWSATEALLSGGVRTLSAGAPLYLYGPYRRGGAHTASSNAEFDASLRARDAAWGIRDLEDVVACAREKGFGAPQIVDMPANNLSVIFYRI
ncbi:MAG TPA: DUF938 domain-containing protein [Methylocystis sp.]